MCIQLQKLGKSLLLSVALGSSSLYLKAPEAQPLSVNVNNFRGDWNATSRYHAGDMVGYQSQSYIAQTANRNKAPTAGSGVWHLLAARGLPGTNGTNGTNGTDGAKGPKGETGPKPVYAYTLVVGQSPTGSDNTGRALEAPDYTSITAALNAIPANLFDATAVTCSAHYLVKVLPGVYPEPVTMKPCVDLEGSGEVNTRISPVAEKIALIGASESEVRNLQVELLTNLVGDVSVVRTPSKLRHVTVFGVASSNSSVLEGIGGTSMTVSDVSVKLSGSQVSYGVNIEGSGPSLLEGVTVDTSSGGGTRIALRASGSSQLKVTNSNLGSGYLSVFVDNNANAHIANSELNGPVIAVNGGSAVCVSSYDGNFDSLTRNCLSSGATGSCVGGAMYCDSQTGYIRCDQGSFVHFRCSPGTVCKSGGPGSIICDFP